MTYKFKISDAKHHLAQEMFKDHMSFNYGESVIMPQCHIIIKMIIKEKPTIPFTGETLVYKNISN